MNAGGKFRSWRLWDRGQIVEISVKRVGLRFDGLPGDK